MSMESVIRSEASAFHSFAPINFILKMPYLVLTCFWECIKARPEDSLELAREYTYLKLTQIRKFEYVYVLEQRTGMILTARFCYINKGFMLVGYVLPHTQRVHMLGMSI